MTGLCVFKHWRTQRGERKLYMEKLPTKAGGQYFLLPIFNRVSFFFLGLGRWGRRGGGGRRGWGGNVKVRVRQQLTRSKRWNSRDGSRSLRDNSPCQLSPKQSDRKTRVKTANCSQPGYRGGSSLGKAGSVWVSKTWIFFSFFYSFVITLLAYWILSMKTSLVRRTKLRIWILDFQNGKQLT